MKIIRTLTKFRNHNETYSRLTLPKLFIDYLRWNDVRRVELVLHRDCLVIRPVQPSPHE